MIFTAAVVFAAAMFGVLGVVPSASAAQGAGVSRGVLVVASDAADVDSDRIPDAVEKAVCGTLTCATGEEDGDGDGIPDWTEVQACGSTTCASSRADKDGDGIPNFAEQLTCGSATCSNSREDADADGVGDWIEYVICGDRTCATGLEDYDGNGISDADELAACVVAFDDLAMTGGTIAALLAVIALALVGGGWLFLRRGSLARSRQLMVGAEIDGAGA